MQLPCDVMLADRQIPHTLCAAWRWVPTATWQGLKQDAITWTSVLDMLSQL